MLKLTEDSGNNNHKYFCKKCRDRNWLIQCNCGRCSSLLFRRNKYSVLIFSIKGHKNIGKSYYNKKGKDHWNWKGGRKKHKNYWYLYMPDYFSAQKSGYVLEHVYFYQEYHKVCVLPWIVVHHIDPVTKDYCNNMIWNLQTMTKGEHISMHKKGNKNNKKDMSGRLCIYPNCKNPKNRYRDKKGQPRWYIFKNGFICNPCHHREVRRKDK